MSENYYPIPQPDEIRMGEKDDAMGAYLMMFATFAVGFPLPIVNLIAALIYLGMNTKKSPFVRFHSIQSLLSQIPVTLLNAALIFWTIRNLIKGAGWDQNYFGFLAVAGVAAISYIAFSIVAAVRAKKGRFFYFIFFGKLSYEIAFKIKERNKEKPQFVNKAPY